MALDNLAARLQLALSAGGLGTWSWDRHTGTVTWDATMERLYGMAPGTSPKTYDEWAATRDDGRAAAVNELMAESARTGEPYVFEQAVTWPDGSEHWLHAWGRVLVQDGEIVGAIGCTADFTERKAIEVAVTEYAARIAELAAHEQEQHERMAFLATLSEAALRTTDHRRYMQDVVDAAVPRLGDWAVLRFRPEPGAQQHVAVGHVDPDRLEWLHGLRKAYGENPDSEIGAVAVMRHGQVEFVPEVNEEYLSRGLATSRIDRAVAQGILDELGLQSLITVPLRTTRGIVGALQLVMAGSGRRYSESDLSLAELAADRVAVALDGMWLNHRQGRIARTLQTALLPPSLPEVPGVTVASRYWPAGVGTEVGGDFYDLFQTGPDQWSVVIGDVCGSGPDAAAVVGIARHTTRAAARHGHDHVEVLHWLNDAIILGLRDRFATAVYSTLRRLPGGVWEFTSSSAGHPFPIVVRSDGSAFSLGEPGTLLGVFEETTAVPVTTTVHPGDVIVLYTDGITDRPPPHDLDTTAVEALVARSAAASATAAELADVLHAELELIAAPAERDDDIALLVLRIT